MRGLSIALALFAVVHTAAAEAPAVRIGSKKFTESVVLGEMLAHLARSAQARPINRRELGGTRVLWEALLRGDIDAYPEYTGTIAREILAGENLTTDAELRAALDRRGIVMGRPLGFNNTYAIGMKKERAEKLGIRAMSDLVKHSDLKLGFSEEFMNRRDGWPALRDRYRLPHRNARGLDHDLAYRGL